MPKTKEKEVSYRITIECPEFYLMDVLKAVEAKGDIWSVERTEKETEKEESEK